MSAGSSLIVGTGSQWITLNGFETKGTQDQESYINSRRSPSRRVSPGGAQLNFEIKKVLLSHIR